MATTTFHDVPIGARFKFRGDADRLGDHHMTAIEYREKVSDCTFVTHWHDGASTGGSVARGDHPVTLVEAVVA